MKEQISIITQEVIDGHTDPLLAYAELKDLQDHLTQSMKVVKDVALEEAMKYESKQFEHNGFKFELRDGRATYNYKGVQQWNLMKEQLARIEKIAKASALNGSIAVDPDTGEEIQPAQVKYSEPSLIVKNV